VTKTSARRLRREFRQVSSFEIAIPGRYALISPSGLLGGVLDRLHLAEGNCVCRSRPPRVQSGASAAIACDSLERAAIPRRYSPFIVVRDSSLHERPWPERYAS